VPVPGDPYDACLRELHAHAAEALPVGTRWFDCHTHTGWRDPDGYTATAEEILAALDRGGHDRALVFSSQEPDGYPAANDRVLAEAAASGGRLQALCRVDPHAGALAEAKRSVAAGAVGVKLHPRAERFALHDRGVEEVVAFAGERRLPVIIHAGRGIPALGRDTVELARRYPGARLILAHAGISDLAWIWRSARELPNLLFDTAWWNAADLLALFALVPPGQILYASDMPYGSAVVSSLIFMRIARAVGLDGDALASIAGGQLERLLEGEEPADMGPAPGPPPAPHALAADRAVAHLTAAISRAFVRADAAEPLALARLACDVPDTDGDRLLLEWVARLVAVAEAANAEGAPVPAVAIPALGATLLAGTPGVGAPALAPAP
jgi:hypothetical protein